MVTGRSPAVDGVAEELARRVLAAPPTLAAGRLVAVDGPAGAGKTTLAAALRRHLRDALRPTGGPVVLIHMDNVYDGWDGLEAGMRTVDADVVAPLLDGRPGSYRRYDWLAGRFAEKHTVEPCEVLLVEGVGSAGHEGSALATASTLLVWVEAPDVVRLDRAIARDGEETRDPLAAWRAQEDRVLARERVRARADVVVDGTFPQPSMP